MSQAEPDDDGRAADSSGCSTEFEAIVASWRAEGSFPRWPDDPATGQAPCDVPSATTPPAPPPASLPEEEDHFIPPDPPPLPRLGPPAAVGLVLLVIGVVLLAAPELVGLGDSVGLPLGLLSLALGLGWLVLRSWRSERPDDQDDDGAVL